MKFKLIDKQGHELDSGIVASSLIHGCVPGYWEVLLDYLDDKSLHIFIKYVADEHPNKSELMLAFCLELIKRMKRMNREYFEGK